MANIQTIDPEFDPDYINEGGTAEVIDELRLKINELINAHNAGGGGGGRGPAGPRGPRGPAGPHRPGGFPTGGCRKTRRKRQKGGGDSGPEMHLFSCEKERDACREELAAARGAVAACDQRIAALRAHQARVLARASEALAQRNECRRQYRELLQDNDASLKMLLEIAKKMEQLRDANVLILRTLDKYAGACGECGRRAAAACCGGGGGGDDASTGGGRHTKKRRTRGRRKRRRRTRRRRKRRQRRTRRGGELFGFRRWVKKKTGYTARKEAREAREKRDEETEQALARLEGNANNRGVINNH